MASFFQNMRLNESRNIEHVLFRQPPATNNQQQRPITNNQYQQPIRPAG
jgi:hypothetical protein